MLFLLFWKELVKLYVIAWFQHINCFICLMLVSKHPIESACRFVATFWLSKVQLLDSMLFIVALRWRGFIGCEFSGFEVAKTAKTPWALQQHVAPMCFAQLASCHLRDKLFQHMSFLVIWLIQKHLSNHNHSLRNEAFLYIIKQDWELKKFE